MVTERCAPLVSTPLDPPSAAGPVEHSARNLLTGTLTQYVLLFVNVMVGIFLMPFTIATLGKARYGLWMLAASMTAYLQLLDLGYGNGLVRQVTQADARGDERGMNVILSTFFFVYCAIGLVSLAGVAVLAWYVLPSFPNLSPDDVITAQLVVAILGVRIALAFPMSVFGAVTTARQRFALTSGIAIVVALAQGATTYVLLKSGYGVVALVAASTLIGILSYVAYATAALVTFPGLRLSMSRFSLAQVREVTAFSAYLFVISIAIHLGVNVDNLIVGAFVGTSAIALYTVALRLSEYQRQLCSQLSGLLFPVVVRFDATRDTDALRSTLVDSTRIVLGLVGGVTVCLLAFGGQIVSIWMGPGFADSILPLYVLLLGGVVMVAQGPTGHILLAAGRQRLVAVMAILEIAVNVGLSLALVGPFGLTGVAVGTALPYAVLNGAVLFPVACRSVGLSTGDFAAAVLKPTLVAVVPAAAVAAVLHSVLLPSSLIAVMAESVLVGGVYLVAFCAVGLGAPDRARYLGSVRQAAIGMARTSAAAS